MSQAGGYQPQGHFGPPPGGLQGFCNACGQMIQQSVRFCAACGAPNQAAPQQRLETRPLQTGIRYRRDVVYSGFWRRVGVVVMGGFVTNVPINIMVAIAYFGLAGSGLTNEEADALSSLLGAALGTTLFLAWIVPVTSRRGGWYAMRVGDIKLVDARTMQTLSYGRVLLRNIAVVLNVITFGLGWLMILWTKKKQTLADMACNTVVIREKYDE